LISECWPHLLSVYSITCLVAYAYCDILNITKNVKNSFFSNGTPLSLLVGRKLF
jgi:hypothetical protein